LNMSNLCGSSHPPSGPIATRIIRGPPPLPSFGKTTCGGGSIRSNPSVTSKRSIARCDRDRAGTPWPMACSRYVSVPGKRIERYHHEILDQETR
jgi:hypothetical protein